MVAITKTIRTKSMIRVDTAFAGEPTSAAQASYNFTKACFGQFEGEARRASERGDWVQAARAYAGMASVSESARKDFDKGEYPESCRRGVESFEHSTRRVLDRLIITA